ncbi:MAG: MgtC/SapB family protein [Pirellulaceae bacterium]
MLDTWDVVLRLLAAASAGALIGWEREWRQKPAGLRTHMLVTMGSAAFLLAGLQLHEQLVAANEASGADLMKLIAGVAGGIGFLGAGSILRSGGEVTGLTTAASIWVAAAIGIACGLGFYVLAATCVVMSLGILLLLGALEQKMTSNESGDNPSSGSSEPEDA